MLFMLNLKCNIKNNIVTQFDYRGLFKQVTFLHTCDKYTKFQYTIQLFPNLDRIRFRLKLRTKPKVRFRLWLKIRFRSDTNFSIVTIYIYIYIASHFEIIIKKN